jgi:hypothetical protein
LTAVAQIDFVPHQAQHERKRLEDKITTPFALSLSTVNEFVWATVCCSEVLRGQPGMPLSQICADVVFPRYGGHPDLVAEY